MERDKEIRAKRIDLRKLKGLFGQYGAGELRRAAKALGQLADKKAG